MYKYKTLKNKLSQASFLLMLLGMLSVIGSVNAKAIDIPYTKITLDNGLRLIVHEDRKAPVVAVSIWYHVGSKDEPAGKSGFAHLFEHLMFNGTENYDDEYFGPFELAGATDMNGTTSLDRTNYFQTVPTPALDMALWMESDRMGHLLGAITQEKLDEQRGVVQNEKRQGENAPYGRVWDSILTSIYPKGHPYSWTTIGSMEDLNAASLEDVKSWFKQYYGAANAVIVLAGDIDAKTAKAKVERYFGDIPAGPPLKKKKSWIAKRDDSRYDIMYDKVPRTRIHKVWNVANLGHEDSSALQLAAGVLGASKNSRLYKRLVYKEQIATSVSASYSPFELSGIFAITADVKKEEDIERVKAIMDEELARFLKKGPKKDELALVLSLQEASAIRALEKTGWFGGKAAVLAQGELYQGDPSARLIALEKAKEIKPAMVKSVVNKWLAAGDYNLDVSPFPTYKTIATKEKREKVPGAGEVPNLTFPTLKRSKLDNGLNIIVAERKGLPIVDFELVFDGGYSTDKQSHLGRANFAMGMLTEGTKTLNSLEIAEKKDMLGAKITSGASLDKSTVGLNALKRNLQDSLALYSDIVLNANFPKEEIERERTSILAKIKNEQNSPRAMAFRVFPPLLYDDSHPYSIPLTGSGTESSVNAIKRNDLLAFKEQRIRPDNATMIVTGDISQEEAVNWVKKYFGKWKAPQVEIPKINLGHVKQQTKSRLFLVNKEGAGQSMIVAGHVVPSSKDEMTLINETMNDIIGGSFTSRLNMNLREDKSWSYGARSTMVSAIGPRPLIAYAPVQTDKTKESVLEIQKEFSQYLNKKPATEKELNKIVESNIRKLPGKFESMVSVRNQIVEMVSYQLSDNYIETYVADNKALTLKDIHRSAKSVLKPEAMTWVIVGDLEKIEGPLRTLSFDEIHVVDSEGKKIR